MQVILHIVARGEWERARREGVYRPASLAREGFIHCSAPAQVVRVANASFRGTKGLVLLCIDPAAVRAEIRREGPAPDALFPHIYGPLNLDAVVRVLDFRAEPDGSFRLPPELGES
jgi:uncharacterized protein (DUF952 family)